MNGEWPEQPSLRFLIHWALRREELCDPCLCPDARMTVAGVTTARSTGWISEPGLLLRRALELEYALKAGVTISLDEIAADEFWAMRVIQEERESRDRETRSG